jgi:hypothetical protein
MSDSEIGPGGSQLPEPNTYNPRFSSVFPLGTPVAFSAADEDAVIAAKADAIATAGAIGVVIRKANGAFDRGGVRYNGPVTLTAAEWATVLTGESELTTGKAYYVSTATAGLLTKTKPASPFDVVVGYAASPLTLFVQPGVPVAVGG